MPRHTLLMRNCRILGKKNQNYVIRQLKERLPAQDDLGAEIGDWNENVTIHKLSVRLRYFLQYLCFQTWSSKKGFEVFVVSRLRESPGSSRIWSHPLDR